MPYVGKSMDRRRSARRRQLNGAHTAVSWNSAYPVGTAVRYWPVYPPMDGIPPEDTKTRSEAWTIGDGSVVACVDGRSGGVCLSHIEAPRAGVVKLSPNDRRVLDAIKRACDEWDGFAPHGSGDWIAIRRLCVAGLIVELDGGVCQSCSEPHDTPLFALAPGATR
jgi:hypothetical protein